MLRILYFAKTIKNKQFWQLIRILYFAKTYFKLKFWLTIKIYPQPKVPIFYMVLAGNRNLSAAKRNRFLFHSCRSPPTTSNTCSIEGNNASRYSLEPVVEPGRVSTRV